MKIKTILTPNLFLLLLPLFFASSCFKDSCDSRVSTEFRNGNELWVPYSGVNQLIFRNDDNDLRDTMVIEKFEAMTFQEQNLEDCEKEVTHMLQRAEMYLSSDPENTRIAIFQSSEDAGLFSLSHDEREIFFFFREKVYEIENDNYEYFPTYTFNSIEYDDMLRITCDETFVPCPNYRRIFYQRGDGLVGYELDNVLWLLDQ